MSREALVKNLLPGSLGCRGLLDSGAWIFTDGWFGDEFSVPRMSLAQLSFPCHKGIPYLVSHVLRGPQDKNSKHQMRCKSTHTWHRQVSSRFRMALGVLNASPKTLCPASPLPTARLPHGTQGHPHIWFFLCLAPALEMLDPSAPVFRYQTILPNP